jgi:hypothetical protein
MVPSLLCLMYLHLASIPQSPRISSEAYLRLQSTVTQISCQPLVRIKATHATAAPSQRQRSARGGPVPAKQRSGDSRQRILHDLFTTIAATRTHPLNGLVNAAVLPKDEMIVLACISRVFCVCSDVSPFVEHKSSKNVIIPGDQCPLPPTQCQR